MNVIETKNNIINKCIKLPFKIETAPILAEVDSVPSDLWNEFRSPVHNDVKSLFVKGYPPIQHKPDTVRPILEKLPKIKHLIYDVLPGSPAKCLVAKLAPGGIIPMHRDGEGSPGEDIYEYFRRTIRVHIPIYTNNEVHFFCNGQIYHMSEGEVWTLNNLADHGVLNNHDIKWRIHIIVDLHPNATLAAMFEQAQSPTGMVSEEIVRVLMQDSKSPAHSPYAKGKPVPSTLN
jgi:hypothetical protein